jgi:phage terminase large subunit-like protein
LLPNESAVGLDTAGLPAIVDELSRRGIVGDTIRAVSQGRYLAPAIYGLARKLADGTFTHAAQPMMAWCVDNAKAVLKGSAVVIEKETAGVAKIDPFVALLDATMLMSRNPESGVTSADVDDFLRNALMVG